MEPFPAQEYGLLFAFYSFWYSLGAKVDLKVSWIGPIALFLVKHLWPIHDTINQSNHRENIPKLEM